MRHAKAEEHTFSKHDFNRNITDKGIKRASKLALELKENVDLDANCLCISSSANRALQTAHIFVEILDLPKSQIIQKESIYEASYKEILNEINQVPAHIDTLFVFGHNPGLSDLVNYLCDSYITLTTSAIAEIKIEDGLNFAELSGNTAYLKQVISE